MKTKSIGESISNIVTTIIPKRTTRDKTRTICQLLSKGARLPNAKNKYEKHEEEAQKKT